MLIASLLLAAAASAPSGPSPLVEQVDDFGFYQVEAPSFVALDARHKRLAYWLARSGIALDPIIYDQLSAYGVKEKKLVGALIEDPNRLPAKNRDAIVKYAKFFLANRGNHNGLSNKKFVPEISADDFMAAAHAALKAGAKLGDDASLDALLTELNRPMFDLTFEPSPTNSSDSTPTSRP